MLVEPRRLRDRATELLDEEVALSESLATTWGLQAADLTDAMPRLHLGFDRLLQRTSAKVASLLPVAESSRTVTLQASGWPPVMGDSAGLARRLGELAGAGSRVVICADGRGSAERMAAVLDGEGLSCDLLLDQPQDRLDAEIRRPGVHIVVAPLDRGGVIASSKLAIVAEPDVTGRRRPHRQARPRPRATEGFFDDLAPGDYVVHNVHGVARFAGMVTRSMGGAERDYLLLEYRGGDRLYLPSEQIDAITPYTGGESPALNRMGGAEWSRQKARVRAAVREVAKELVELYRRRHTTARPRLRARHALAGRARAGLFLPGDPGPAEGDRRREGRHGTARADGPTRLRRRRLRQDRGRGARGVQGGAGRAPGRRPRADDAARPAALPDLLRQVRALPDPGRGPVPLPYRPLRPARSSTAWPTGRSTS